MSHRPLPSLLLCLLAASCSADPQLLSLSELPAAATTLELRPLVNGQVGAAVVSAIDALAPSKRVLRLALGAPLLGAPLFAQIFDSRGCLVAYGQAEAGQPLVLTAISGCPNEGQAGPLLRAATPRMGRRCLLLHDAKPLGPDVRDGSDAINLHVLGSVEAKPRALP